MCPNLICSPRGGRSCRLLKGLVDILKAYLEKRWQALFTAGATRDDMVRSGGTKPLPCCREVRS